MESLIRDYLAQLLLKEFEFPALITLTNIQIDNDFKTAKAKIKILETNLKESKTQQLKILKELNQNKEKISRILFKQLNIKPFPKIIFELNSN